MKRPSAHKRGYNATWRKARLRYLEENPLCRYCEREGAITAAEVVDHIIPHRGDDKLFWSTDNWQPLCKPCHDTVKQSEERNAHKLTIGLDGWPLG